MEEDIIIIPGFISEYIELEGLIIISGEYATRLVNE